MVAPASASELQHLHPEPPALRVFDAGMGDGTVLMRSMRQMHRRFPTLPFYVVGKEISLEDVAPVASTRWPTASTSIRRPCSS